MLWIVLLADAEKWHECHLNGYAQVVDIQYQDSVRDLGYSGFVTNVMHISTFKKVLQQETRLGSVLNVDMRTESPRRIYYRSILLWDI